MKIVFNILSSCILKWNQNQHFRYWIFTSLFIICSSFSTTMSQQLLKGNVPAAIEKLGLKSIGRLDSNTNLHVAIGLPLRNKEGLTLLLKQLYDPSSPNYHHYLTPDQFTEQFGPTENDYQSVVDFAKQNGLNVISTSSDRLILNVDGKVTDIEKTFHVQMLKYQHPNESRTFFAPDVEPSVKLGLNILEIAGLNNYSLARPLSKDISATEGNNVLSGTGSGPSNTFIGNDFRAAYVPGVSEDGTGQIVSLIEFSGYNEKDITDYEDMAYPTNPHVKLNNVLGNPGPFNNQNDYVYQRNWEQDEVCLDIEMAIAMAPRLSEIRVYIIAKDNTLENISDYLTELDHMTNTDNNPLALQLSSSWQLNNQAESESATQYFQKMQIQGQSFFQASGDNGAYTYNELIGFPADSYDITIVGGTHLTTSVPGGTWTSETVWNNGNAHRSGGGISTQFGFPYWQDGVINSANGGSTTWRNIPDVALTADNIYTRASGKDLPQGGTSAAAPLWAGYTALINQRAAANSHPPIGFLNPLLYSIGKGSTYNSDFHDITSGNNNGFNAVSGYDLCTGWGTPNGLNLMGDLVPNNIHVDQKLSTETRVGTIGKWNGSSFSPRLNPGDSISISPNSTIVLQGDQNVYSGEKYNNWIRNTSSETDASNHHSFVIRERDKTFISNFQPMSNATIQSQLLENASLGGYLKFQDPWLIDYQEAGYGPNLRNQGMTAPFDTVNYSSNNLGTNTSHGEIFLNQFIITGNYYSLQAPLTQTINGHNCAFQNWNSPDATFQQVGSNPSGYDQKAVIFSNPSAIVTANYKGINISNSTSAFTNSSQQKVVFTSSNNYYHMVYESLGMVWYEISTNCGASWQIANNGLPISKHGKLPSIDCNTDGSEIIIVWVDEYTTNRAAINMTEFSATGEQGWPPSGCTNSIPLICPCDGNLNPVVAYDCDNRILVTWIIKNDPCNPDGIYYWYGAFGFGSFHQVLPNPLNRTNPYGPIINASINNISISGNKDYISCPQCYNTYEFTWEENNNIHYCQLFRDPYNDIKSKNVGIPSNGAGFTNNTNPSISAVTQNNISGARLTWVGNRTTSGGGGASKIMAGGTTETKAVFRDPSNSSLVWSFSNNVHSTVINKSPDCYSIAWSKSNTDPIQFTDSHTLQTITTLDGINGITGNDLQLSNGNHDYLMRAVSFNSATAPYYFSNKNLYTQIPQKIEQNAINNGREGIVKKDSCQFYFGVGDVKVDNKIIEFTPISDTTHFQSLADLNSYLVTNPIQINNNSELFYSVQYGITDSLAAMNTLKGNSLINFKVEILDAVTGEVLGVSDNVNFDSLHIFEYNNIAYQVNTEGMGNRTIKIRLKITTNSNIEYSLKSSYSTEEVILQKSKTNHRVVLNLTKVNSYDLSQNYPNPFNPSTTIKYQIPKAGIVTLKVYDILGKEVASLLDEYKNEGRYSINFNASKLASGVYIYQIKASEYVSSKKMMLLK